MLRRNILLVLFFSLTVLSGCYREQSSGEGEDSRVMVEASHDLLKPEVRKALLSIDSDYSKVRWGVEYSPIKEYPGLVASVAPYRKDDRYCLLVGITNLNPFEVVFSGNLEARAVGDEVAGSSVVAKEHVGSGQTAGFLIDCEDGVPPDGRIRWSDMKVCRADDCLYVPFTADWAVAPGPDGNVARAAIGITVPEGGDMTYRSITALVLDKEGRILSAASEMTEGLVPQDGRLYLPMEFSLGESSIGDVSDMCIFVGL